MNNTQNISKPIQKKCIGFSRKIDRTTYNGSCFYGNEASETMESKVKRMIQKEIKE